jgi:hypothetical protein
MRLAHQPGSGLTAGKPRPEGIRADNARRLTGWAVRPKRLGGTRKADVMSIDGQEGMGARQAVIPPGAPILRREPGARLPVPQYSTGTGSRLRQRYQVATDRHGTHKLASVLSF